MRKKKKLIDWSAGTNIDVIVLLLQTIDCEYTCLYTQLNEQPVKQTFISHNTEGLMLFYYQNAV